MDKEEARSLLAEAMSEYRMRGYGDLLELLEAPDTWDVAGASGARYQLEVQAVWDAEENGNLRVIGSIDDGGLAAFMPLSDDFIISPSGSFVGK